MFFFSKSINSSLISEGGKAFNQIFEPKIEKSDSQYDQNDGVRINNVKDKRKSIKKKIHRKKREPKQGELSPIRQKNFKLNIRGLEKNLNLLINFKKDKKELEERLIQKNLEINSIKERIRDIRKYG